MTAWFSLKTSTIYEIENISTEVHKPWLISAEMMIKCTALEQFVPVSICIHISGKERENTSVIKVSLLCEKVQLHIIAPCKFGLTHTSVSHRLR